MVGSFVKLYFLRLRDLMTTMGERFTDDEVRKYNVRVIFVITTTSYL